MLFEDGYSFRFQKRNVIYMISLHDESWEIYYFLGYAQKQEGLNVRRYF